MLDGDQFEYWSLRWKECLPPPSGAGARAERLGRDLDRYRILQADIAVLEDQIAELLALTDGQVATVRSVIW